mmetsp:Transcript_25020/g.63136  ORF Transcript_25020/g.63136 Transcript_25020/m.63136 type:complete len:275 (-) Transcript_25020:31-855(-)
MLTATIYVIRKWEEKQLPRVCLACCGGDKEKENIEMAPIRVDARRGEDPGEASAAVPRQMGGQEDDELPLGCGGNLHDDGGGGKGTEAEGEAEPRLLDGRTGVEDRSLREGDSENGAGVGDIEELHSGRDDGLVGGRLGEPSKDVTKVEGGMELPVACGASRLAAALSEEERSGGTEGAAALSKTILRGEPVEVASSLHLSVPVQEGGQRVSRRIRVEVEDECDPERHNQVVDVDAVALTEVGGLTDIEGGEGLPVKPKKKSNKGDKLEKKRDM